MSCTISATLSSAGKVLLFTKTAASIKAGTLNLIRSHKYRSLDDYLLPQADWEAYRDDDLQRDALERFTDWTQVLPELEQALHHQYQRTNRRSQEGHNPLLKFRASGTFHITTPKEEEPDSASLQGFFPERK